jgi:hypothetical protein
MAKRNVRTSRKKGAKKTARGQSTARRAGSTEKTAKTMNAARGRRARRVQRAERRKNVPRPAVRASHVKVASRSRTTTASRSRTTTTKIRPSVRAARPKPAALERERRKLTEEEMVPTPPSTLHFDRKGTAAASGRASLAQHRREHNESGPDLTAGDIDADWGEAYAEGDEAPGGDNPTPDQDVVEEIGRALGVEYDDDEELKGSDKIIERDKHRWEYDPASAEDYRDRTKKQ